MRILALDLGRRTGVAEGDSDYLRTRAPPPRVESLILRGASAEVRVRNFSQWLSLRLYDSKPDLIVTERPLNPVAQKSAPAAIDMLAYYFCLHAIAATFGLSVEAVPIMSARKHFTGVACAAPVRGRKRTSAEATNARTFINEAVLKRAVMLGYLSGVSKDWDQANACCLFDFAAVNFARETPAELAMFNHVE